MPPRYAAARPRRAGEAFARQHHGDDDDDSDGAHGGGGGGVDDLDGGSSKRVKFDVRNPSALAPDARGADDDDYDDVLDADVIGGSAGAPKRGAVNIDGYDSDSENETFQARADQRKRPTKAKAKKPRGVYDGSGFGKADDDDTADVNLIDQLDNYDKRLKGEADEGGGAHQDKDDDDDDDMFAANDDDDDNDGADSRKTSGAPGKTAGRKTWKEVRFLSTQAIEGEEDASRSGGHIRLDEASDSEEGEGANDSETGTGAADDEVDEEVGAGGRKRHAPKIDAFNMRQEQEEGAFDEAGNYIRKAADPDALHDRWLDGLSRRDVKRAAAAHEQRAEALRERRRADDRLLTADLLAALLTRLQPGETPLEALARLGRAAPRKAKAKRVPQWRRKQMLARGEGGAEGGVDGMEVDGDKSDKTDKTDKVDKADPPDAEATRRKADIDAMTEAADHLLNRDYPDIYDTERERLARAYAIETGEAWQDPRADEPEGQDEEDSTQDRQGGPDMHGAPAMWEYRWVDGRDGGATQGPYDGPTMRAWQDAGYFAGVEFRPAGSAAEWRADVSFA